MLIPDIASELDDGLHTLDLSFDLGIEVFVLDIWKAEKVNGSGILIQFWCLRNERTQALV